jgi:hypothetical protein
MPLIKLIANLVDATGVRALWRRFPVGSIETRTGFDVSTHAPYAFGVLSAAQLAKSLGLPAISVAEFGVAGGRGLLALERISREVSQALQIRIDVFGFDSGSGMPEAADYRDLPHVWAKGFYKMDVDALKPRLNGAQLIIGDVAQAIPAWAARPGLAPIGFIAFDLDYYTSTVNALRVFDGPGRSRLPRVFCYFDDVMWPTYACHNEFVGELLAIREFNAAGVHRKLCPIHLLRHMRLIPAGWNDQIYVLHDFLHPQYCMNITEKNNLPTQQSL